MPGKDKLEFISSIANQLPVSVVVTDVEYQIVYTNHHFQKLYGYTPEELVGKDPTLFNAEATSEEIQREIYLTVSGGETGGFSRSTVLSLALV